MKDSFKIRRRGICDIETDSLTPTKIHCAVFEDLDSNEVFRFRPDDMGEFRRFLLEEVDIVIGHNFLTFDGPNIGRLLGVDLPFSVGGEGDYSLKIIDTLILSRLIFTGVRHQHSLDSWGQTLGYPKIDFNEFEHYSEEMLTYCEGDVKLNRKLYEYLLPLLENYSDICIWLEHKTQHLLNQQSKNGFFIDIDKAYKIHDEVKERLTKIEVDILKAFPPLVKVLEEYTPRYKKDGDMTVASKRKIENAWDYEIKNGVYYLLYEETFNLGSPKQVVERMNDLGWTPVEFTKAGSPKISEANFETLPANAPEEAKLIATWLMLNSRLKVFEGWFNNYNPVTGRVHGRTLGIGAITHRMAHRDPNMANIPAVRSEYGGEMRECFTVENKETHCMVGVDISGIQLRILAHYMEDTKYTEAVCNGKESLGTDIHSVQRDYIKEVYSDVDRDGAKKFIYSMILGASGFKLGVDLGSPTPAMTGNQAKARLFQRIPAFKKVQMMCAIAAKRGFMFGLDGRRAPIKSEHFALSVYLQNGEAIIMKYALHLASIRASHLDWKQLVVVHDEVQCEVLKEHAEELGKIIVGCIEDAGTFFELRCPVTGGYKIGNNWKETH